VPCGITDKGVTSMQKELGEAVDTNLVKAEIKKHFEEVFEAELL
jgi:lipoyl(octanoyl) transferase